ncbi:hypothetical protein [Rhizobium ruizarguesonis]|uniref:hypothetical protein n=1 Tax=Rhizobium ruizarguesonis TaxID=2081791 RepID=UPI003722727B
MDEPLFTVRRKSKTQPAARNKRSRGNKKSPQLDYEGGSSEAPDNEARVKAAYVELMRITNKTELKEAKTCGFKNGTEAFRSRAAVGGTWLRQQATWPDILARINWIKENLEGIAPGKIGRPKKQEGSTRVDELAQAKARNRELEVLLDRAYEENLNLLEELGEAMSDRDSRD